MDVKLHRTNIYTVLPKLNIADVSFAENHTYLELYVLSVCFINYKFKFKHEGKFCLENLEFNYFLCEVVTLIIEIREKSI